MAVAEEEQKCLKLLAQWWPPFVYWSKTNQLEGCMKEVLEIFVSHLGVCYEIVRTPGDNWGNREKNGTYSGLMGIVYRGEVDMTIAPVGVSEERSQVMDFSEYLFMDKQVLIHKRPFPQADMAGFIKPYSAMLWLLFFLSSLVACVALMMILLGYEKLLQYRLTHGALDEETRGAVLSERVPNAVYTSILWTFSSLLLLGVPWDPRGLSVRTLSVLWLIVAFIISTVYRSNLKAMLILPKVNLPFTNIEEFLETDIPLHIIEGSLVDHFTRDAPGNTSIGRLRARARVDSDMTRAIREVFSGQLCELSAAGGQLKFLHDVFTKDGYCGLYQSTDGLLSGTILSLAFPKGSRLKPKIDRMIRGLRESGILDHLYLKQSPNATNCLSVSRSSADLTELRPLELEDFFGVFCLYGAGIIMSILVFILELLKKG